MPITKTVVSYFCRRCENWWVPADRHEEESKRQLPIRCGNCKTPYWDRLRVGKGKRTAAPAAAPPTQQGEGGGE